MRRTKPFRKIKKEYRFNYTQVEGYSTGSTNKSKVTLNEERYHKVNPSAFYASYVRDILICSSVSVLLSAPLLMYVFRICVPSVIPFAEIPAAANAALERLPSNTRTWYDLCFRRTRGV